jgi:hypothetical protein
MVISNLADEGVLALGVCPTSRETESVERLLRNWTKLFQVLEVRVESGVGLSELAQRNLCFPDRRLNQAARRRTLRVIRDHSPVEGDSLSRASCSPDLSTFG